MLLNKQGIGLLFSLAAISALMIFALALGIDGHGGDTDSVALRLAFTACTLFGTERWLRMRLPGHAVATAAACWWSSWPALNGWMAHATAYAGGPAAWQAGAWLEYGPLCAALVLLAWRRWIKGISYRPPN